MVGQCADAWSDGIIEETGRVPDVSAEALSGIRERERALIDRVRGGDRLATRELIDQHKDRLHAFIRRMVHQHHDVEEICQEAFLKAFASLESFSSEFRFSTWLFTIAYRVSLNHLRRKKALTGEVDFATLRNQAADTSVRVAESEEAGHLRDLVWSAVDRLSPPQRATLLLFYRHEFGCHEIARILNLPVATVKSHLHRGRNRLQALLQAVPDGQLQAFRNRSGLAG